MNEATYGWARFDGAAWRRLVEASERGEVDLDVSDVYMGSPDSLDAAWAEAEAALPERGYIRLVMWNSETADGATGHAYAQAIVAGQGVDVNGPHGRTDARTEVAAALRALAAKLCEGS